MYAFRNHKFKKIWAAKKKSKHSLYTAVEYGSEKLVLHQSGPYDDCFTFPKFSFNGLITFLELIKLFFKNIFNNNKAPLKYVILYIYIYIH